MSASWTSRVRFEVRITRGGSVGPDGADLGDRHLEVGQDLEEVRLELLVGPVDLVDEEDGRAAVGRLERLEERPLEEERGPEDVVGGRPLDLAARLEQPDLQHLAGVVPLVDGRRDVEALVALEPDQAGVERLGQGLGELGLADAGLALEEQRALEREGEEDRGRQGAVGDVVAGAEGGLEALDRGQLARERAHLVHQPAATSARAASKPSAMSVISASVMTNGGETWRATPRSTRVRIP